MKCGKCGQETGYWKTIWLLDAGGTFKEWIPHTCIAEEVAPVNPE